MFLLDTMVLSEQGKRAANPDVTAWLARVPASQLFVSVITLGEIAAGIEAQRNVDPAFSERLEQWARGMRDAYVERTLPVDTAVALRWGELYTRLKRRDTDLLIAATALEHDLTVVTRNSRHFEPTGVKLLNPYLSEGPYAPARLDR
jgi:toxin FitB